MRTRESFVTLSTAAENWRGIPIGVSALRRRGRYGRDPDARNPLPDLIARMIKDINFLRTKALPAAAATACADSLNLRLESSPAHRFAVGRFAGQRPSHAVARRYERRITLNLRRTSADDSTFARRADHG